MTPAYEIAIRQAIGDYNNLGLRIRFDLSFGVEPGDEEITLFRRYGIGFNGEATTPANGNPGRWITLRSEAEFDLSPAVLKGADNS